MKKNTNTKRWRSWGFSLAKTSALVAGLLAAACLSQAQAAQKEYLINRGFESGDAPWIGAYWGGFSETVVGTTANPAHSGTHIRYLHGLANPRTVVEEGIGASLNNGTESIPPGTVVHAGAWVRCPDASVANPCQVRVRPRPDNGQSGTTYTVDITTSDWTFVGDDGTGAGMVMPSGTWLAFRIYGPDGFDRPIYVDDCQCLVDIYYLNGKVVLSGGGNPVGTKVAVKDASGTTLSVVTITNALGTYSLPVGPGTYTVAATNVMYYPGESTPATTVTTADAAVPDITLTKQPTHMITGTVTGLPSGKVAIVSANGYSVGPLPPVTTALDGSYSFEAVDMEAYDISASCFPYAGPTQVVGVYGSDVVVNFSLSDSTLVWYKFDGNVNDSSSWAKNGTLLGAGAIVPHGRVGGSCLSTVAGNGGVSVPLLGGDAGTTPAPLFDSYTMTAWVLCSTVGEWQTLYAGPGWEAGDVNNPVFTQSNQMLCSVNSSTPTDHWYPAAWGLNRWHFVSIVYNSSALTETFYLDGVPVRTDTLSAGAQVHWEDGGGIGCWGTDFNNRPLRGEIDDFRICNMAATAGEIASLYASYPAAVTHTITATTDAGATLSPVGSVSVYDGYDQTFTITANFGYVITAVTVDGVAQTLPVPSYTFNNVTAAHTIAVTTVAQPMYSISGTVRDHLGAPIAGASVYISSAPNASSAPVFTLTTAADGTYSQANVPAATVYVAAGAPGKVTSVDTVLTLNANATGVDFVLGPGLFYNFDDGTLQGWTDIGGGTNHVISRTGGDSGAGQSAPNYASIDDWNQRDYSTSTLWLRSPAFVLNSTLADVTFYLAGGPGAGVGALPANESGVPKGDGATGGFMGLALRDRTTGNFVLKASRTGDAGANWLKFSFSAADLAANTIPGRAYTLDFIDNKSGGGFAWICLDTVTIPGVLAPAETLTSISGKVTEASVGVAGILITATPGSLTATTDVNGDYTIANAVVGLTYTLTASSLPVGKMVDTAPAAFTAVATANPNKNFTLKADPTYDPALLFMAKSSDCTGASWPLSVPAGQSLQVHGGSPDVQVINGVKWELNTHADADCYRFGSSYWDEAGQHPIPCNGASIVVAIIPTRGDDDGPWNSIVDIFYDRLVLAIRNSTGELIVRCNGVQTRTGYILPAGQPAIVSLVVQPDGTYEVYVTGALAFRSTLTSDMTALVPGVVGSGVNGWGTYINVGRNDPDGWPTFNGNIGDVFVYTTALGDTQRESVQNDIATRLGIPLPPIYSVTTTATGGGISPNVDGVAQVLGGSSPTFTFYSDTGLVNEVRVDGILQPGHPQTYTFTNVSANHTLDVTFTEQTAAFGNDNFADAFTLSSTGVQTGSNNRFATFETGEPECAYPDTSHTVWFKWTAPSDGLFTISTAGSRAIGGGEFDAIIGCFTGASVDSLTQVVAPKDTGLAEILKNIAVTAGTTYYFQVGGDSGDTEASNIQLTWSFVPNTPPSVTLSIAPNGSGGYNITATPSAGTPTVGLYRSSNVALPSSDPGWIQVGANQTLPYTWTFTPAAGQSTMFFRVK